METNSTNRQGMSYRAKLLTSSAIYFCTFTLGLTASFLGPSLLEFATKFGTDISTISKGFSVITISFLVGAILGGIIFNYVNRQIASAALLVLLGISIILLPLVPSMVLFFLATALLGISAGGYDTAQIVWIIEMWENPRVYIQIQHFSFAVGTMISPLMIKPFLSIDPDDLALHSLAVENGTTALESSNGLAVIPLPIEPEESKLYIPFIIGGCIVILGAILLLILFRFNKYKKTKTETTRAAAKADRKAEAPLKDNEPDPKEGNANRILLIVLSAIFLGCYQGMEVCTMQFLSSFTHYIDLRLSKQDGALILTSLTGSFTLGRALGILLVLRVIPEALLLGNIILIILGNSTLLLLANESLPFLWTGSILLGIGFSTVFPSFYGYIEKHLKVTNVVGALMILAGGLVAALYPIIIGSYIEQNPFVLMYTNFFSATLCIISFVIIYVVTRKRSQCFEVESVSCKD